MDRGHIRRLLTAGLALGLSCSGYLGTAEAAPGAVNELAKPDAAQQELFAQERRIAERGNSAQAAKSAPELGQRVPVAQLVVNGFAGMGEKELKALVPEATQAQVDIVRLSQQLQVANSSGAMHLSANFRHVRGGATVIS